MRTFAIKAVGGLAVLSVAIVSLVPGHLRPHILASSREEHVLAYLVTACLLAANSRTPRQRVALGVVLTICAGSFEVAQLFIAGRTASAKDFAAGALGIWIGLHLPFVMRKLKSLGARRKPIRFKKISPRVSRR